MGLGWGSMNNFKKMQVDNTSFRSMHLHNHGDKTP